ncbi:hypothetical protein GOBAR_AA29373 [Gossypium barbadense]|uniref:C2H2-type domain-containing protein n=1 Tax=Gossypium barbadense TaxID=3634 RepID=A0A2P5WJQ4_GOSBA|nr:hypothetical protein GOBAR_AA29373 [Gossypium barbadense]
MGHKKKNVAPRSKQFPALVNVVNDSGEAELSGNNAKVGVSAGVPDESNGSSSSSVVKADCERALTALRRGNHTKALRLMKESCTRHENSAQAALVHRVQGTVCLKVASIMDDPNAKNRHLKSAIDSARKAVELSPNSIEFAHFYANLLYDTANDAKEYEEVVQECERALAIENPVDPAKESLQEESQQQTLTAEARILQVQSELRSLIQKSHIASISTWMKNLGSGEEKFRFIPVRRVTDDPMEVRLVPSRRPNEIKKATKTPEERRKEIEVRVAAARLLQQQKSEAPSSSPQLQSKGEKDELDLTSGSGQRGADRRRRKNGSTAERKDWVRSYWNSMSIDLKRDLLRIRVSDIKAHFGLVKDELASDVLSEALEFAEAYKTWNFWVCCRCSEKFADSESHMQHVVQEHMGNLIPKMQNVLPQSIDSEWIEMLLNCSWNPLDISAAIKMIGDRNEQCNDCFDDAWESSPAKEIVGVSYNCGSVEGNVCEKVSSIECKGCDGNKGSVTYPLVDCWPTVADAERAKLLERIHATFELLIRHKYLAASHLNKVIQFTMDELQSLVSGSQLLNHGIDQTPMCICFLGSTQLRKVLKFLQDLSHSCGLARYSEKTAPVDDVHGATKILEVKEKIVLNADASCLLLDEHLLPDAAIEDSALEKSRGSNGNEFVQDADALLSWIFSGPSSQYQLASWVHMKAEKTQQGLEILQMLEKEFYHLQSLCERKCDHMSYEEALQALEDLCREEGKKRETATEFVHQSYESVLRKHREELVETESDDMFLSSRFELDAITNVLQEAEALNINQFGYENTYAGVTSQLCDLESGEDDDWRAKDYLHQADTYIEVAIQRQKEQLSLELSKIDARIMRNVTGMQQLELKLESVSAHDYQSIMLPLVKSYLRAHLEDMAEKDATEKSDAAREAFLAELARDAKKVARGGSGNSRHSQEKVKDKKKNKEFRKSKDSKGYGGNELHMLNDETAEQVSGAADGDHLDSKVVSVNNDDLKQQEEEFRRKIELEEEERMLEETLEYQRWIENGAKPKHLAEQNTRTIQTHAEKAVDGLHDACLDAGNLDIQVSIMLVTLSFMHDEMESWKDIMPRCASCCYLYRNHDEIIRKLYKLSFQQHLAPRSGVANKLDSIPMSAANGRKGRRHKGNNKFLDGKYQVSSSENQNIQSRISHGNVEEQVGYVDGGPMDSAAPVSGEGGTKTLRQLQAEEDDEERFQADLKTAIRQSLVFVETNSGETLFPGYLLQSCSSTLASVPLGCKAAHTVKHDTYQAQQRFPLASSLKAVERVPLEVKTHGVSPNEVSGEGLKETEMFGTGLLNDVGEYNCFLNVIIQVMSEESSFDELLNLVERNHQLACDQEAGGCGKLNYVHHILSNPPHVFTTVLGWQNTCESADDIAATLAALTNEIDISVLYRGIDPKNKHNLVSVVCYYGQHYHCFAYSHDHERWVMYDDQTVKVIGSWADVLTMCKRGCLQPQVLFFEAVN